MTRHESRNFSALQEPQPRVAGSATPPCRFRKAGLHFLQPPLYRAREPFEPYFVTNLPSLASGACASRRAPREPRRTFYE